MRADHVTCWACSHGDEGEGKGDLLRERGGRRPLSLVRPSPHTPPRHASNEQYPSGLYALPGTIMPRLIIARRRRKDPSERGWDAMIGCGLAL